MFEAFVLFLIQAVSALAGPAGISATVATAIAYTVAYGTIIGASMAVSKLLAPKMPSMGDMSNRGIMTRNAVSARQIIYGQAKVSGTVVFLATSGTKNEYLHIVVALAGHEVQEIGDVYFNEDLVLSGSGDGFATGKYAAAGSYTGSLIHKHLGTTTQTVDTTLQTDFPVDWDSNHRLRGIAYIYCKLTFSNEIFVGGIPNISCVVKGKKVYDPDSETTAYSANPALCLRDYLTDADLGMGMDASEIDDDSVIAAAAVCVEQVQVKPVSPVAYENRYECNGQAVTSSTPDSIIGQILSSMGGTIAYSGGQVVVYAAAYRSPTVTLDESQMAGGFTVSTRTSARDRVNAVKGTYVSADNQWSAADFPQITSATYLSADDGIYHWRDVVLPFTTSSSAAQRIAVINLRQAREEIIFTARWNLTAMQLRAGDTVSITNANLGWSSKVFEVIAWSLANQGTPPTPVIEMQLRETASSVYSWTVTDEIAVEDAPNTTLPSPFSITAPSNLTLTADGTTQFIQADGSVMPRIKVAWSAPNDQFVQSGGKTVIEYKEGAATTYLTWSTVDGDQTLDYISSDVRIGTSYNVRLYAQSFFNTSSTYTAVASITPAKDTTAPVTPTGLTASVGTGRAVSLDWNDNTETDFSEYGIYRNTAAVTPATANTYKIAEVRASRFVDTEVTIGTTYFYWVNAYDNVENVSGFTNYVQATPSVITAGPIDPTAPSTPAAPTLISTTVYLSTDGGSFARVSLTAPPLPAGAVALDVLYRRTGASDYIIGNQIASAVSYAVSIDDLSVGVAYEFAARGISFSGAISAVSSVLSQSAPSNTTLPSAPTALTYISGSDAEFKRSPETISAELAYSVRVNWTPPSDKSVLSYEAVGTNTDTDAAANSEYAAGGFFRESTPESIFSSLGIFTLFVRVRSVDRTGQKSAWAGGGTNLNNYWGKPAGTMMNQSANAVAIVGGSISGITDIAIADGGTGASTTAVALENLLPSYTTNGTKFLALNIGATDVEWTAGGGGSGTVISVAGTGTVNGITLTGTVTTAGTLTLGGTLTNVSLTASVTGTLPIANGGTGASTTAGARTALGLGTAATANLNALGVITVDKMNFTGGDPATNIDENYGITLNGDATHPVRVVGAALAMGDFDLGNALTAGRIYLAEDRSIYALGTDLVYDYGSGTVSIPAGIGSGTVTSVSTTGTVNGITLTGTVTTAGFLTLSGAITDVNLNESVTGTLGVARGGTGSTDGSGARENLGLGTSASVLFGNINTGGLSKLGGNVSVTGNITATGNVSVTGNVTAVGSMSMGSGFFSVGSGQISSGGLSVDNGITTTVVTATTRIYSPAAALDVVTATTRIYSPAASLDVVTAATRIYSPAANLGVVTVDRVNFAGGDPVTNIDEAWGITLNGDAVHPVRVVGAALAMGSFDQNVAMTAGRIYLAEDRSIYTSGTDLLFNNGSVTISITAAPVVPVVTTVILGYPMCSVYGGTDGDYLRQIVYNSVTYLCFGA